MPKVLSALGMIPLVSPLETPSSVATLDVILNGRVLGVVKNTGIAGFVKQLRILKATGKEKVMMSYYLVIVN